MRNQFSPYAIDNEWQANFFKLSLGENKMIPFFKMQIIFIFVWQELRLLFLPGRRSHSGYRKVSN